MITATFDPATCEGTSLRDAVVDVRRRAEHLAHEARALTTIARDALEDGVS